MTSPYDFAADTSIDPYICTYDYTEYALRSLVRILCGEAQARGKLPKGVVQAKAQGSRQQWLVEKFNAERDSTSLTNLLDLVRSGSEAASLGLDYISAGGLLYQRNNVETHQFVVRNSSTKDLFGFCAAYYVEDNATGYLGFLVVDPKRRKQSIGDSLHARTMQALEQIPGIATIELGFPIPMALPGVPGNSESQGLIREWFGRRGWTVDTFTTRSRAVLQVPTDWKPPDGLSHSLSRSNIKYEIVHGSQEHAVGVLEHIRSMALPAVEMLYNFVLAEKANTGIIRAKNAHDGTTIGMWRLNSFLPGCPLSHRLCFKSSNGTRRMATPYRNDPDRVLPWSSASLCRVFHTNRASGTILVCSKGSELARRMPANCGLLLGSLVPQDYQDHTIIIESLILLGLKHLRKHGVQTVLLQAGNTLQFPSLEEWGLTSVQHFAFDSALRLIGST